jgi:hypothetical protein
MTVDTSNTVDDLKTLVSNADSRLQELEKQKAKLVASLKRCEKQVKGLRTLSEERKAEVEQARIHVAELDQSSKLALEQADFSKGTKLHKAKQSAWQESVFAFNNASKALDELIPEGAKKDKASASILQSLQTEYRKAQAELQEVEQSIQFSERGKLDIQFQLDQALAEAFKKALTEAQDRRIAALTELASACDAQDELSKTALQEMAHNLALQTQIKPLVSYHDETTRLVESALVYRRAVSKLEASFDIHRWIDAHRIDARTLSVDLQNMVMFEENTDNLEQWLVNYRDEKLQ